MALALGVAYIHMVGLLEDLYLVTALFSTPSLWLGYYPNIFIPCGFPCLCVWTSLILVQESQGIFCVFFVVELALWASLHFLPSLPGATPF